MNKMTTSKSKVGKKTKEFLAQQFTKKWMEENQGMMDDYYEICHKILMFKAMCGINIGIILKDNEEVKGREFGKGVSEELFNAQNYDKN